MPRAPKVCGTVGCPTLLRGKTYCPTHERQRGWPCGTGTTRTDTTAHRKRRLRVLARDGHQCQLRYPGICVGTATIVDHVQALGLGGMDTDANCQAACEPCHRRKTSREGHQARGHAVPAPQSRGTTPSSPLESRGTAPSRIPRAIRII